MQNKILRAGFAVVVPVQVTVKRTGCLQQKFLKGFIIMKLLLLLTTIVCLQASADVNAQTIKLSFKDARIENIFKEIEKQTSYRFIYTKEQLTNTNAVSIEIQTVSITTVLDLCFNQQPIVYSLETPYIIIKRKPGTTSNLNETLTALLKGNVVNEEGEPVAGATVTIKGTSIAIATDINGEWKLEYEGKEFRVVISSIGYETKEVFVKENFVSRIVLEKAVNSLDEMLVIAYGQTTKRLNTGNVSKVTAKEIATQPVSNPLLALEGRVPGLIITQSTGYAGGAVGVQLRGQNSLIQGSEPLFVIDGIPFSTQNNSINQVTNAASTFGTIIAPGGISPFYLINPDDIESIEVLKDADATAIYGSRGANGVILITTKKGKQGKTTCIANMYTGWSRVTRTMDMLNTEQYRMMRKEAFINDAIIPTTTNAADLLLWDSTRYTDLKNLLLGGTAITNDINLSVSGGTINTSFLLSGSYHRETTVLPTSLADHRGAIHSSFVHTSANKKLKLQLVSSYSYTKNNLPAADAANYISRPPNLKLYDSSGNLNWQEGGVTFKSAGLGSYGNPLALFNTKYTGNFQNLNSSMMIEYSLIKFLSVKANLGYNTTIVDEVRITPSSALDPFDVQAPNSNFGNSRSNTWIIEPQAEFKKKTSVGKFEIIIGSTFQKNSNNSFFVNATNYSSDLLLTSISGAGAVSSSNSSNEYKYNALFGRINYNNKDRYILNVAARRDGSSRFGPGSQFNNFGSIGGAWIFSNEKIVNKIFHWLSYGKLRSSYGISGNDLIGDYQFLDSWTTSSSTYQGIASLNPTGLFNAELAWETNKKFEAALELGLVQDRIQLSVSYFRNRSGNQLVSYNLPIQTGFASIKKNLDALIQNKGWEFSFQSRNFIKGRFKWTSQINLTIMRNKLLAFPNLESSSYASTFVIGEPVSVQRLYKALGVDQTTGLYSFLDSDGNGSLNKNDRVILKNTQPVFYGGMNNIISYHGFSINVFIQVVKQTGVNYLKTLSNHTPGYKYWNQPVIVLNRWQKAGEATAIQRFTTLESGTANQSNNLLISDAVYSDASYARVKNVSLSYNLPGAWLKKIKADAVELYVHGQNLFTITNYVGADPENQNMYRMPPLRTFVTGIKVTF